MNEEELKKEIESLKGQIKELREQKDLYERLFRSESRKYDSLKRVFESFKTLVTSITIE